MRMTKKMYAQADEIKTMIETMCEEESLTEQEYIERVLCFFREEISTPNKRLAIYNHLHHPKMDRRNNNWYWLLRRIRNTGQIDRLHATFQKK